MKRLRRVFYSCGIIVSVLSLLACNGDSGGGYSTGTYTNKGGGDSQPPPPVLPAAATLTLSPETIKLFHFTWADVADATYYELLENPDGVSGYSLVASIPQGTGSFLQRVFLPEYINASFILRACNTSGCTNSAPVMVGTDLSEAVGYVKASNANANDWFGNEVAMSADGSTLVVGAYREDSIATGVNGDQGDNNRSNSGAVYVFTRTGNNWSQQAYLKASNTSFDDFFGWSLALSSDGNTLAVGAIAESSGATGIDGNQFDTSASLSGAVYVFTRSGTTWSQQAYVKASNTGAGDNFGVSVALAGDGNTMAVGAYTEDSSAPGINGNQADNLASASGAVYVFTRSGTAWSQEAYVKASNPGANDFFGWSIVLSGSGDTLAVSALFESSNATGIGGDQANNAAFFSGAAYVFERSGGAWMQQAYIKASNTESGDLFGRSLALAGDGNTLAVGADSEDSIAIGVNGSGANNAMSDSGAVYVYGRSAGVWSNQAYIKASNTDAGDSFGRSLALSEDGAKLAVGAVGENSAAVGIDGDQSDNSADDSGAVYIYSRQSGNWSHDAYVKASNTEAGDQFGFSVALSGDGDTMVAGALYEAGGTTGIDQNQADNTAPESGAVYLF